jgi:hypothetical protein
MATGLAILGIAIAMHACILGWNAAEHRKAGGVGNVMAILFYAFAATFVLLLAKLIFF